jgi:hypothetical protein
LVRPGGVEPPTALQSGAHDGYKPSALPVELWAQICQRIVAGYRRIDTRIDAKWSGWLDSNQRPPASEAGTLAGLSYTLLALRREIESLSPVRQTGRLTRCVTERKNGTKKLVRLGRLERPLHAFSTHSLCRLGYRRESAAPVFAQTRYDGHPRSSASSPPISAFTRVFDALWL